MFLPCPDFMGFLDRTGEASLHRLHLGQLGGVTLRAALNFISFIFFGFQLLRVGP